MNTFIAFVIFIIGMVLLWVMVIAPSELKSVEEQEQDDSEQIDSMAQWADRRRAE